MSAQLDPPPRAARGAVLFAFLASGILVGSWAARLPTIKHALGLSPADLGLALFGLAVGSVLAMPLAGWTIAREGSRGTAALTLAGSTGALVLLALAPDLVTLCLAFFLMGGLLGSLDIAINVHGLTVERLYRRPLLARFHAAFSAGGLVGAGIGAAAAGLGLSPLAHFAIVAGVLLMLSVPAARSLLPASADVPSEGPRFSWPPRQLLVLGIVGCCCYLCEGAIGDWSSVYMRDSLSSSTSLAALGYAAFSLMMVTGRLGGDWLTTRIGPVALVRGGGLLAAASLALLLAIGHPVAALAGFAGIGAGLATVVPLVLRAAGSRPEVPSSMGVAAVSTMSYLGLLAGPPVIGSLATLVGLPRALTLLVLLTLLVALLAASTRPRRGLPEPI